MHALYCIAVVKVLYPLVIEQLLKHEPQKRNLKKRKWIILLLLCVPNGFTVIQKADVGGDKVCTQTAKIKLILWWEENYCNLGGKPISFGCSANCLKF